jgi:hypothetical protein
MVDPVDPVDPPGGNVEREIHRFLRAVAGGELWEHTAGGALRMRLPRGGPHLLEALVCRRPGESRYTWRVRTRPSPAGEWTHYSGLAPDVHEAMRAAERVIEEHRPDTG